MWAGCLYPHQLEDLPASGQSLSRGPVVDHACQGIDNDSPATRLSPHRAGLHTRQDIGQYTGRSTVELDQCRTLCDGIASGEGHPFFGVLR